MATKDELLAYADANGVQADASMLKTDIEQALRDAGHNPDTLTPLAGETMSDEPASPDVNTEEEQAAVSSDARFSTYREANAEELAEVDEQLPPGRIVVQELGEPSEGGGTPFSANR